ncbi:MAG: pyridoxamine 5'-phosphate oxidase family protein [Candidatus Fermentibacteraceae bacterium]|nr:pyridoxamine 5'-phosphate oxidase family protein [Candidatus Fermentibacteraceae bacterium]MBN2609309.1 pyridoxamine 5'-phosphate oxidase family protein [Candidatus Fermentibacteraceae bacterium]
MPELPERVIKAWEDREGPVIFTTVSGDGVPNAIFASCVNMYGDDTIVVANNHFSKTLSNIRAGSKGSILFRAKSWETFQIKGGIEYFEEGPVFEYMKEWNPPEHPGHGAAALRISEVWSGARRLL